MAALRIFYNQIGNAAKLNRPKVKDGVLASSATTATTASSRLHR
jgi:hypothetical protein